MLRFIKEGGNRAKFGIAGIILGLALLFVVGNMLSISADGGPDDITQHVSVTLDQLYATYKGNRFDVIKDGKVVDSPHAITVGDVIEMIYKWEIPKEKMNHVAPGKYFIIPLLDSIVFTGRDLLNQPLMLNKEGQVIQIGTFNIETVAEGKRQIRVKFDRNDFDEVRNAYIGVTVSAAKPKDEIIIDNKDQGNSIKIKVEPSKQYEHGYHPEYFPPMGNNLKPIYKWGTDKIITGTEIPYTIPLNMDVAREIFTQKPVKKKKVYVIDELPNGLKIKPSTNNALPSVRIVVPCYSPGVEQGKNNPKQGQITDEASYRYPVSSYAWLGVEAGGQKILKYKSGKKAFDFVEYNGDVDTKPWTQFKDEILASGKPTLGIWRETKFIVYFGDIPNSDGLLFNDIFTKQAKKDAQGNVIEKSELEQKIIDLTNPNSKFTITNEMRDRMIEAYVDKPISTYILRFDAQITGDVLPDYKNTISMSWDDGKVVKQEKKNDISGSKSSGDAAIFSGDLSVKVEWIGTPKESATVRLLGDNEQAIDRSKKPHVKTLTAATGWEDMFRDLYSTNFKTGKPFVYSLTQDKIEGYTTEIVSLKNIGFTVTNTELTSVNISKKWIGREGTSASVELFKDGIKHSDHVLNSGNNWSVTVNELPKFRKTDAGQLVKVQYTVKERPVAGYRSEVQAVNDYNFVVKNFELVDFPVEKIWKNPGGTLINDPKFDPVHVKVFKDGSTNALKTLSITKEMGWKGSFEGLDKLKENGTPIAYTFDEVMVPGFRKNVEVIDGKVIVTNIRNEAADPVVKFVTDFRPESDDKYQDYISFNYKTREDHGRAVVNAERIGKRDGVIQVYFAIMDNNQIEGFTAEKNVKANFKLIDTRKNEYPEFNAQAVVKDESNVLIKPDGDEFKFTANKGYLLEFPADRLDSQENYIDISLTAKTEITITDRDGTKLEPYYSKPVSNTYRIQRRDLFDLR